MWQTFLVYALAVTFKFSLIDAGNVLRKSSDLQRDNVMAGEERVYQASSGRQLLDAFSAIKRERSLPLGNNNIDRLPFGHMSSIPLSQYSKIYFVMDSEAVKSDDNQRALTDLVRKILSANSHGKDTERPGAKELDSHKLDDYDVEPGDETRNAPVTMNAISRYGRLRTAKPLTKQRHFSDED